MNNGVISAIAFVVGAAVGTIVSFKFAQNKYEQIAKEEIASVKEHFTVPKPKVKKDTSIKSPEAYEKPDNKEYSSIIKKNGYHEYSTEKKEKKVKELPGHIEVISPEEYGECYGYDCEELTYYADKVLANLHDDKIEDVDNVVGYDSLTRFGEYEDDSVFVRNNKEKTDYQILLDPKKYSEVIKSDPHLVGDR